MATAAAPSSGDGLHFVIPEGTASISQPDWVRDGHDSWAEWGVDKETLTGVTIPTSVTSIGRHAFFGCSALRSVDVPASVASIGPNAFYRCSSLAAVTIPASVTSIGAAAFFECSSLARADIPMSVTSVERSVFNGCSSLISVAIPATVTSIDYSAFKGCSSLTRVHIPAAVTRIEDHAFSGCSSLTSVAVPTSVTMIREYAFNGCSSLTNVEIGASATTLGGTDWRGAFHGAFEGCTSLAVLMVQPIDTGEGADAVAAATATAAATTASTSAVIKAFNEQAQFPAVTKIWATDDIITSLQGSFAAYRQFKDVPRALRAAPDATTWAGVQLWLWWLPPTSFSADGGGGGNNRRVVCKSRQLTIWTTMLCGHRAVTSTTLPDLPEELWLCLFGFLKHDQQPTFLAQDS